jgi:AraC-like DNA-binding protein
MWQSSDAMRERPPPDVLAALLRHVRISAGVFGRVELGAPWGAHLPARDTVSLHHVVEGEVWLDVAGTRVRATTGDLLLLPHGAPCTLRHHPAAAVLPAPPPPAQDTLSVFRRLGGDGRRTVLLCAELTVTGAARDRLIRALPPVVHFPARPAAAGAPGMEENAGAANPDQQTGAEEADAETGTGAAEEADAARAADPAAQEEADAEQETGAEETDAAGAAGAADAIAEKADAAGAADAVEEQADAAGAAGAADAIAEKADAAETGTDAVPGFAALLGLLRDELRRPGPGAAPIAARIAELLLLQAVRGAVARPAARGSWRAGLADERIARALDAVYARPEYPWTLRTLARVAGMGRTAFTARFRELVGQSPFAHLTGWRMELAAAMLREEPARTLAEVAAAVGYSDEFAFGAAFRREVGISPGAYRTDARGG